MYDLPHVFLDELSWDMRYRNTDWSYVRYVLPRLSEYEPALSFTQQKSLRVATLGNLRTVRTALGRRIGWPVGAYEQNTSRLDASELARSSANLIFAHRAFPLNAGALPVVWQNAVLDPAMQRSYGASVLDVQQEIALKGPLFALAAAVQVSTEAEVRRHRTTFPEIADRFVAVPFFTPHARACMREALHRHCNATTVRLLFVGNNAMRKGLDQLLAAFVALPAAVQARARLTVISSFDRSSITLPRNDRITVRRGVDNAEVMAEMARSHIFVNVARFESYGIVFHEAMSQGMACLAPDWEVQRELFADGIAGLCLACDAATIEAALEELICDEKKRYALGLAAWERFQEEYAPAVVARRYAALFRRVLQV